MAVYRFDLVGQAWVPVVRDGGAAVVSLRDCLVDSRVIDGFAVDSPRETVALFRQVLLPVHLWVLARVVQAWPRDASTWLRWWRPGDALWQAYTAGVQSYLAEQAAAFDLFGERPFGQVAGLRSANGATKPSSVLIASAASGNNVPLFCVRTEAEPPALRPDEAVRALLATQCWDTAGIKTGMVGDAAVKAGKTTGNLTGPLGGMGVVVPIGRTLWETLMLNTPIRRHGLAGDDRPQWHEAATAGWRVRPARGLLDLLTWQARRIRLIPETDPQLGVVVRQVLVGAGDRLVDGAIPLDVEPHTAWRLSGPKGKQVQRPIRHVAGRTAWQGMSALLATAPNDPSGQTAPILLGQIADLQTEELFPNDYPLQVLTVGVEYGTQSAVVEDTIADSIPLPVLALSPDPDTGVRRLVDNMVDQADALRRAANDLENNLRLAMAGEKLPWDKGSHLGDRLIHQLNPTVRQVLSVLQHPPTEQDETEQWRDKIEDYWRQTARRLALAVAEPVLNQVSTRAFVGRALNDKVTVRAATAEMWYRSAITKTLGAARPAAVGGA